MKKRALSLYWFLNIVLIFFIYCKFTPISNQFTSAIFDNVIINYLIIIFNILIGKYVYDKINGEYSKLNFEILFNCVLAIICICSVVVDYTISFRWSIVQVVISICLYLICYFVVMKISIQKYLMILLIFSLLSTILIGEAQYIQAFNQSSEKKIYSFEDESIYKQYKRLYKTFEEMPPYTVLDYSEDSVYVQDLTTGQTEYYSFDTKKEQEDFIGNHTMGIDVKVPQLGTDVSFDDNDNQVFYRSSFSETDIIERMKKTSSFYFSGLMGMVLIISLAGYLYEKNK